MPLLAAVMVASTLVSGVAYATGSRVQITKLQCNAPGNDYNNLNGEYVVFKNTSSERIAMGGWKVHDRGGKHVYYFPKGFKLGAHASVTLHTGSGRNSAANLYWGMKAPVWNNDGDTATLLDRHNRVVSRLSC